jgi:hypothetical protein
MDYPYNLFKTREIIQFNKIKNNPDLFNYTSVGMMANKSILKIKEAEINKYIQEKGLTQKNLSQFNLLKNISDNIYKLILLEKNNIYLFSKKIIEYRYLLLNYKQKIDFFLENFKKNNYDNFSYDNPIDYLELLNMKESPYLYNNSDDIKLILDCLIYGSRINLSMPSIGPIFLLLSSKKNNFYDFTSNLLNNLLNDDLDIVSILPIIGLNIDKKISKLLVKNKYSANLNNSTNNFKLIENSIRSIKITLEELLLTKDEKKVKNEFLIPYKIEKNKIVSIKVVDINIKLKNIQSLVRHNFEVAYYVIADTFKLKNSQGQKNLEKENYKNVLFCFLFFIINLINEIQKEYINKINFILNEITESVNLNYKNINLEEGFAFVSELHKSVYNFKIILLNNLYQLFQPSRVSKNYYGMTKNTYNFFVPESIFLSNSEYIYNNFPFSSIEEIKQNNMKKKYEVIIDKNKFIKFMIQIKLKTDIYDPSYNLEFGGNLMNKKKMKNALKILNHYFTFFGKNNEFYLFIIDNLIDILMNKNIPYELFNVLLPYKNKMKDQFLKKEEKDKIDYFLFTFFDENLNNSVNLSLKLYEVVEEIKKSSITSESIFREREILKLSANLYYYTGITVLSIIKKSVSDIKMKNDLIKRINERIFFYDKKLQDAIL